MLVIGICCGNHECHPHPKIHHSLQWLWMCKKRDTRICFQNPRSISHKTRNSSLPSIEWFLWFLEVAITNLWNNWEGRQGGRHSAQLRKSCSSHQPWPDWSRSPWPPVRGLGLRPRTGDSVVSSFTVPRSYLVGPLASQPTFQCMTVFQSV